MGQFHISLRSKHYAHQILSCLYTYSCPYWFLFLNHILQAFPELIFRIQLIFQGLMIQGYQKVIALLNRIQSPQVVEAEVELKRWALGNTEVFGWLHQALRDPSLPSETKITTASFINVLVSDSLNANTQIPIFRFMTQLLEDSTVESKHKRILLRSLTCVMSNSQKYFDEWKDLVCQLLNSNCQSGFLVIEALAISETDPENIYGIINNLLELSFSHQVFRTHDLSQWLKTQGIITTWRVILDFLLNQDSIESYSRIKYMGDCKRFCETIFNIYESFSNSSGYFAIPGLQRDLITVEKINKIKTQTAEVHLKILTETCKHRNSTYLLDLTSNSIDKFVNSILVGTENYNLIVEMDCTDLLLFLLQIIKLLFRIAPEAFANTWKDIFHHILVPLLRVTDEELRQFEENPAGFMQLFEDCCEQQMIKSLKTEAAQFLEDIYDSSTKMGSEAVSNYIDMTCLVSIKSQLNFEQTPSFPLIPLETVFQILSIFSYQMKNRQTTIDELKSILSDKQLMKLPPLELSRVLMFLSYNCKVIFQGSSSMQRWVDLALNAPPNTTLQLCGIDFIYNNINHIFSNDVVEETILKVLVIENSTFWQLLRKMITLHLSKIPVQLTTKLVHLCLVRINREIDVLKNSHIKRTFHIISIIQIFRQIMSNKQYISNQTNLKVKVWECTKYFQLAIEHGFQDELIQFANLFLDSCSPSELQAEHLKLFMEELLTQFKLEFLPQSHYFIAFNNFIMKGDFSIVHPIVSLLVKSLTKLTINYKEQPNLVQQKICISHHLILLQNVIYRYGAILSPQDSSVINELMKALEPPIYLDPETNEIVIGELFDKHLLSRALNIRYLLGLCWYDNNQETVVQVIQSIDKYHRFKIYYDFDIRTLYFCMKEHLTKLTELSAVQHIVEILTRSLFYYMQRVKNERDTRNKYKQQTYNNKSIKVLKALTFESLIKNVDMAFEHEISGNIRLKYAQLIADLANIYPNLTISIDKEAQLFMKRIVGKKSIGKELGFINQHHAHYRKIFSVTKIREESEPPSQHNSELDEDEFCFMDVEDDFSSGKRPSTKGYESLEEERELKQELITKKRQKKLTD